MPALTGHTYYHYATTGQSTYTRPLPAIPVLSAPVDPNNTSGELKKKKREKPAEKTPIPGTEWLKVTTNIGNIFWTHTGRKESVWTVPDEIKDIVEQVEREEQEKVQKHQEAETVTVAESRNAKRKVEEKEHESRGKVKKPKTEESPTRRAPAPVTVEDEPAEDEDEAWQRQMAMEMAMEEETQVAPASETAPPRMTKAEAAKQVFDVPAKIDISLEEGKALFKVCFLYSS
jgi:transcription elongation regulator 1